MRHASSAKQRHCWPPRRNDHQTGRMLMTLTLHSPAFESGAPIPARFDHEQGDLSPALIWDGVPEGTAGLVLLVDDPDAPIEGSFVHWVLYNLDPARRGLAEGEDP